MRDHSRYVQAAIWMIGIGILMITDRWWPGILILAGISMVAGAITRGENQSNCCDSPMRSPFFSPTAPQPPAAPEPPPSAPPFNPASSFTAAPVKPVYDLSWLPNHCPACGGPTHVNGVKVLDAAAVLCPFCGTKISKPE